jgi:hypothetical protein
MKRTLTVAILVTIVGILVGMGIGGFISHSSVAKLVKNLPGAPIVVGAKYDTDQNALVLDIFNPGGLPIYVETAALVFNPKNGTGYKLANLPANVKIEGDSITRLVLNLKAESKGNVNIGDLLTGTLVYHYPYIPQVFTTTYNLTVGKEISKNPGEILEKASKESEKGKENK